MSTKKWNIQNNFQFSIFNFQLDRLVNILLENRGVKNKKEIDDFLNPKLEKVTIKSVVIDSKQLKITLKRIKQALEKKEQIIVFGDYDVDGICGTAILWETLNNLGANVLPYIPHRVDQGYGLSIKGIEDLLSTERYTLNAIRSLIITVDNGIVANDAVDFANKLGIDVIITDHHVPGKKLPKAYSIVHTTKLCGTSVAWMLSEEVSRHSGLSRIDSGVAKAPQNDHLGLVALATVADLVPLTGANRTLLAHGLRVLQTTKRPGLLALFQEAALDKKTIGTYEIGHIIAPRLNAMGRIENAMDSLRLICTTNAKRAETLAFTLGSTNRERQAITKEAAQHAVSGIRNQIDSGQARMTGEGIRKLIFIAHESYQPGVVGLVAGRLVEEFYRPSIVISIGEEHSKASARSVSGFNIIEFIRSSSELLVDAGGHPMAAGFTVETAKILLLQKALEKKAEKLLTDDMLTRTLKIDIEIPLTLVNTSFYNAIQQLAPFGMGNPEPTFVSKGVVIEDMRLVGADRKHIKFKFQISNFKFQIQGIGFGLGERTSEFHVGDRVDIVYTIDENTWNGNTSLQLKVKDIKNPVV